MAPDWYYPLERMRVAAKYLRISVPRAMKLPESVIDKAVTASWANNKYQEYLIEEARKKK